MVVVVRYTIHHPVDISARGETDEFNRCGAAEGRVSTVFFMCRPGVSERGETGDALKNRWIFPCLGASLCTLGSCAHHPPLFWRSFADHSTDGSSVPETVAPRRRSSVLTEFAIDRSCLQHVPTTPFSNQQWHRFSLTQTA